MRVCVFCGSSPGRDPRYAEAARGLGRALGSRGVGLVYGGGDVGLMGELANAALAAQTEVIGVIPQQLVDAEIAHTGLAEQRVVADMHERKSTMAGLADAFVVLPGGVGTLEEFFEVWTWAQLGIHDKPVGLVDVGGFYQPMRAMVDHMVEEGFLRAASRDALVVHDEPGQVLDVLMQRLVLVTTYRERW